MRKKLAKKLSLIFPNKFFCTEKNFCNKNFNRNIFWEKIFPKKNYGTKFSPKNKNFAVRKKFSAKNIFDKRILTEKEFRQNKNYCQKKILPEKVLEENFDEVFFSLNRIILAEKFFLTKISFRRNFFFRHKLFFDDFWFVLVGMVILAHTAILEGNSTYIKPRKLKFGIQFQLTKTW